MSNSVQGRFCIGFGINLLRLPITLITGIFLARFLGPAQYGTMIFLLGTFLAIRGLLDNGSSSAFFTFLSRGVQSKKLILTYFFWLVIQLLILIVLVIFLIPTFVAELIWKSDDRILIAMTLSAVFVQSTLWPAVSQMGESQRLTKAVQVTSFLIALVNLLVVLFAWWVEILTIKLIFITTIVEWVVASYFVIKRIRLKSESNKESIRSIANQFWVYCAPLIPYGWVAFFYEFLDRWLLQTYGGSDQQAYYAIAAQFGMVASIGTASLINLFWKEVSEANYYANNVRIKYLYRLASRATLFLTATFTGFVLPWSCDILDLALGSAYAGGYLSVMVMLLYPIHQAMGQINSTMLYALQLSKAQAIFGTLNMLTSMIFTYLILAPTTALIPGFGLGSVGLAVKMVVMQIITVNVIAHYVSKHLNISFDWVAQPFIIVGCLGSGFAAYGISNQFLVSHDSILLRIFFSLLLYMLLLALLVWVKPSLTGFNTREEIMQRIVRIFGARFSSN